MSYDENFQSFTKSNLLNYWINLIAKMYNQNKYHIIIETILIVIIIYFVLQKNEKNDCKILSLNEKNKLLKCWSPDPLVPKLSRKINRSLDITSAANSLVEINGKTYLNFISFNYLGLITNPNVLKNGKETIKKYAVGSCGPRGFYGTMDIHLNFEKKIGQLLSTKQNPVECVLYADYLGCPSSVITAYAKQGDLIISDEKIMWLFKQGFIMTKAKIIYYKHNDLNDLEKLLKKIKKKDNEDINFKLNRRFIVTETIFHQTGKIVDLPRLIELKNIYKYRLIVDDSHGFGTISKFGLPDFFSIDTGEIDVYVCAMDKAIGSVGAFVVGDREISDHQRLSSFGYVFSASGPPFQISAASRAIDLFSDQVVYQLQQNIKKLQILIKNILTCFKIESSQKSPILFLTIIDNDVNERKVIQQVYDYCLDHGVLLFCTNTLPNDKYGFRPGLRISVTVEQSEKQLNKLVNTLQQAEIIAFSGK